MVGGFGLVGSPLTVLRGLARRSELRALEVISNNVGEPGRGLGRLLTQGQLRKVVGSYFTSNPDVHQLHGRGSLDVEVMPQGSLAEAIRAGGAGIAALYTPVGVGTPLVDGAEVRGFAGVDHVLVRALRADVALIRAHRADAVGNLTYNKSARNFNPEMATAADMVIAEVDELVDVGELSPEEIVTPHPYVTHLCRAEVSIAQERGAA
jgi:3-oxoacid CoA-transferase A subunit